MEDSRRMPEGFLEDCWRILGEHFGDYVELWRLLCDWHLIGILLSNCISRIFSGFSGFLGFRVWILGVCHLNLILDAAVLNWAAGLTGSSELLPAVSHFRHGGLVRDSWDSFGLLRNVEGTQFHHRLLAILQNDQGLGFANEWADGGWVTPITIDFSHGWIPSGFFFVCLVSSSPSEFEGFFSHGRNTFQEKNQLSAKASKANESLWYRNIHINCCYCLRGTGRIRSWHSWLILWNPWFSKDFLTVTLRNR